MSWQNWSTQQAPVAPNVAVMPQGMQYSPEQWAQMQQQNWQQWAQWQQQYQQWHQQYGAEYQKSMGAIGITQPPLPAVPNMDVPPPLPTESKPPLPPEEPPTDIQTTTNSYTTAPPNPGYSTGPPNVQTPAPKQNWNQNKRPYSYGNEHDSNKRQMTNKPNQWNESQWGNKPDLTQAPPNFQAKPPEINAPLIQQNFSQPPPVSKVINPEELSEAEKKFDKEFAAWEAQFNKWKQQNANHPDKTQYQEYEKKWESWRNSLLERREQMRKKRLSLAANKNILAGQSGAKGSSDNIFNKPPPNFNNLVTQGPPPLLNNEPLKFKPSQGLLGDAPEEQKKEFLTSSSTGGIPGLDLVDEPEDEKPKPENDVIVLDEDKKEEKPQYKSLPDFEAISKGINTILGDQKLLNMLSMVTQNQGTTMNNAANTVTHTTQSESNLTPQDVSNTYGGQQYNEHSSQSFEERSNQDETIANREGVNNFDDQTRSSFTLGPNDHEGRFERNIRGGPINFPDTTFIRQTNLGPKQQYSNNRNTFSGTFNQRNNQQIVNERGRFDNNFRPMNDNRPPNFNRNENFSQGNNFNRGGGFNRGENINEGFNRGPNNLDRKNSFNQNEGYYEENKGNYDEDYNNQHYEDQDYDDQYNDDDYNQNYNNQYNEENVNEENYNESEDYDKYHNWFSDEQEHNDKKKEEKIVETKKTEDNDPIFEPTTVVDYDHKPIKKGVDIDLILEPIHMFDYRHKPLNRIPIPQRPQWLTDSVKYIRDFAPLALPFEKSFIPPRYQQETRRPIMRDDRDFNPRRGSREVGKFNERRLERDRDRPRGNEERWRDDTRDRNRNNFGNRRDNNVENRTDSNSKLAFEELSDEDMEWDEEKNSSKKDITTGEKKPDSSSSFSNTTLIEYLINAPGRFNRPPKIVIILRGPPGSGKTYLAKLIKDKEVEAGGSAPRILSLDDYFMVEQEKDVIEDGKTTKVKEMVYEYEKDMEDSYRTSLIKSFKKTITDGYFSFIIVDNVNDKVKYFGEMWSFAKQNGFQVYICQLDLDPQVCASRNIHGRTEKEIEDCVAAWEPTPSHHPIVDASSFLQSNVIEEVEMEVVNLDDSKTEGEGVEDHVRSKWDNFDCSINNLAKLDGVSKPLRPSRTMEEYLQLKDEPWSPPRSTKPGQKRVRWADLEQQKQQAKMRAFGFVVGQTNWGSMMDTSSGESALTQTKYIERVRKF